MTILTEIKYVQKDGEFVVGVVGVGSESPTDTQKEIRLLASDAIRGPIEWNHQTHGRLLIHKQRIMNIPCWYCEDPTKPDHNILEDYPACSENS